MDDVSGLVAPFPWFGGKSRAAHLVWAALGDVNGYVEPFAGSLAVLLARPNPRGVETVNDRDAYLANFWRAVQHDPDAVAHHADWPVSEVDLSARHPNTSPTQSTSTGPTPTSRLSWRRMRRDRQPTGRGSRAPH